jgi:hypothetical protein
VTIFARSPAHIESGHRRTIGRMSGFKRDRMVMFQVKYSKKAALDIGRGRLTGLWAGQGNTLWRRSIFLHEHIAFYMEINYFTLSGRSVAVSWQRLESKILGWSGQGGDGV